MVTCWVIGCQGVVTYVWSLGRPSEWQASHRKLWHFYKTCKHGYEFQAMLDWAYQQVNEIEQIFAYEKHFDDSRYSWCKNTWSKRLCWVLNSSFTKDGFYKIEYTASDETFIHHDAQRVTYFMFHGNPSHRSWQSLSSFINAASLLTSQIFHVTYLCCNTSIAITSRKSDCYFHTQGIISFVNQTERD